MKTDMMKFMELYESLGIVFEREDRAEEIILMLEAKTQEKVDGYSGFMSWLHFTYEGKFIKQSIWE